MSRDGRVENVYDPQGMLENYWFPVREGGKASDVKSIGGMDTTTKSTSSWMT